MRGMKIYGRNRWRPAGGRGPVDGRKTEGFLHHTVTSSAGLTSLAKQAEHMRQLERIHLNQGWQGIGYSLVVFPPRGRLLRARTFEGRGIDYVPSAQARHNSGTVAVAVVTNSETERVGLRTRWELVRVFRYLRRKKGIRVLRGHRDVYPTACPGRYLYALLPWLRKRTRLR
jgi:hypothetical protein